MKIPGQLALILAFSYAGHILAVAAGVPLPAGVIGILLLLAGLRLGWFKENWLDQAAYFLMGNMALFFLPSAVEILENVESIRPVLGRLVLVCILTTVITFVASYATARALQKLTGKKDSEQ